MGDSPKKGECNNFKKTGQCRYGDRCIYTHVFDQLNLIEELFNELSREPARKVQVNLDRRKQNELQQFLSFMSDDKRGFIQEHYSQEEYNSSEDELTQEDSHSEQEKLLKGKYQHIPETVFKRKFLENIMGNFRASKGISRDILCALERDPKLDFNLRTELVDKIENSQTYKKMIEFRMKLPVYDSKETILDTIKNEQVIVISGETGSGKTTQIAQFILDDYIMNNRGSVCHVMCTQPRRISAVSVAQRVADERGENCGDSVGYQIRLDKKLPRKQGSILFCTTGILLQMLHSDPGLSNVTHVLIDEIHERNMDTDFVMTVIREVLPQRKDLKVVLMSATLKAEQFSAYFNDCPIINVQGKSYEVTEYFLEDVLSVTGYVKKGITNPRRPFRMQNLLNPSDFTSHVVPYINTLRGRYRDVVIQQLLQSDSEKINLELIQKLIEYICMNKGPGAILVFLPGWDQIAKLCRSLSSSSFFSIYGASNLIYEAIEEEEELDDDEEADKHDIKILNGMDGRQFLIFPLHSQTPTVNQSQVFDPPPPGVRKIIISTNIAETSITINDVVYIINCGKMKVRSYDIEKNISILQDEWVSKANAVQRRGRAGRVQEGECYHLYTRARQSLFKEFPTAEIVRTRLEDLILKIKLLELGQVAPFLNRIMDSPDPKTLKTSLKLLETLGALDSEENLTPLGFHLAKLPLDPHVAKMILFAAIFSCVDPILSVAACLSFKQPFYMPLGQDEEVIAKKIAFSQGIKSDHLVLAEAFRLWDASPSKTEARSFCKENFLSQATLRDLRKMKSDCAEYLNEMGFLKTADTKDESANRNSENVSILKAVICAGLYPNIAIVQKVQKYLISGKMELIVKTPEDGSVKLHKSSINGSQTSFESPYFMYHDKKKSSFIFLYDTTMVSSLPLILFSHKLYYDSSTKIIKVNKEITFHCERELAILVQDLRREVQKVLDALIMNPWTVDWTNNEDLRTNILRAAAEFITAEDNTAEKP